MKLYRGGENFWRRIYIRHDCPICNSRDITTFLARKNVPVHQNLLMSDMQSALDIKRGNLIMAYCEACGFIFNQAFDSSKLSYSKEYDNTQTCSYFFDNYLSNLAAYMIKEKGIKRSRIVEVGCGKGQFLKKLIEFPGAENIGYGFDPSYVGSDIELGGKIIFNKSFYNAECANIPADVVVCRHVIEHIQDPIDLLTTIKAATKNSPHAKMFFETPCVEWILRNRIIWDFFYEHCSYFTGNSLSIAFELAGFDTERIQHIFGGQYIWLEAKVLFKKNSSIIKNSRSLPLLVKEFARSERIIQNNITKQIQDLSSDGEVALWGAGAKGVTFANIIDPKCKLLSCIVDLNPKKQGKYLPGTGHPIISYEGLVDHSIKNIILMNPNYRNEISDLIKKPFPEIKLIDLKA